MRVEKRQRPSRSAGHTQGPSWRFRSDSIAARGRRFLPKPQALIYTRVVRGQGQCHGHIMATCRGLMARDALLASDVASWGTALIRGIGRAVASRNPPQLPPRAAEILANGP